MSASSHLLAARSRRTAGALAAGHSLRDNDATRPDLAKGLWPSSVETMARRVHRWVPDLIYINSVVALPIARMVPLPDVPVILQVCELQGYLLPILRDYPDLLVGMPTRYLAVSNAVRRALVSDCGIDQDRIGVIHEFIPERRLDEVNISQAGRRDDDTLVIGGAGAVAWYKGTTLWLQTAAEVRRLVGPTARFVLVGAPEGDDGIKLRREVHLLGLDDAVELIPSTRDR